MEEQKEERCFDPKRQRTWYLKYRQAKHRQAKEAIRRQMTKRYVEIVSSIIKAADSLTKSRKKAKLEGTSRS